MTTTPALPAVPAALALLLLASGCAHAPVGRPAPPPGVAMIPLEDLTGQVGAGDRLSSVLYTALAASGCCRMVEPGEVDAAMGDARIRSSAILTRDQTRQFAERLGVRWILTGTALEFGRARTPDGEVPSVGLSLRLIDGPTGASAWAGQSFRSGDDRETVFGWGRVTDPERLASQVAEELVRTLRFPGPVDSSQTWKGIP